MERSSTNLCSRLHSAMIVKVELIVMSNVASISKKSDLLYHILFNKDAYIVAINQTITFFWISFYTYPPLQQTK